LEEYVTSIFGFEEYAEQKSSVKAGGKQICYMDYMAYTRKYYLENQM
jgi:hypothetical protein